MSCPADLGVSYRLSFAAGSGSFPVVTVSGRRLRRGDGRGPGALDGPLARFWTVLAHAMGAQPAARPCRAPARSASGGGPVS